MKIVLAILRRSRYLRHLKWLQLQYKAEVIAFCADVGQEEELDEVPAKAKATGASQCYIVDLVEEFASDFIYR